MSAGSSVESEYDLVYENVAQKLEQQISMLRSLDTKASILLAAISLLFAGYLQLLVAGSLEYRTHQLFVLTELYAFGAGIFMVLRSLVFNGTLIWVDDPEPLQLVQAYYDVIAAEQISAEEAKEMLHDLKYGVIESIALAYEENRSSVDIKGGQLWWAGVLVSFGLFVLLVHLVLLMSPVDAAAEASVPVAELAPLEFFG